MGSGSLSDKLRFATEVRDSREEAKKDGKALLEKARGEEAFKTFLCEEVFGAVPVADGMKYPLPTGLPHEEEQPHAHAKTA